MISRLKLTLAGDFFFGEPFQSLMAQKIGLSMFISFFSYLLPSLKTVRRDEQAGLESEPGSIWLGPEDPWYGRSSVAESTPVADFFVLRPLENMMARLDDCPRSKATNWMSVWARRIFRILGRFCQRFKGKSMVQGLKHWGFTVFTTLPTFFGGFLQIKRDRPFGFWRGASCWTTTFSIYCSIVGESPLDMVSSQTGDISKWFFLESDNTPLDVGWKWALYPI